MKDLLKEGEIQCPKCQGSGAEPGDFHSPAPTCSKCWGAGKLDWIDLIMGKPNPHRTLEGNWTIEMEKDINACYGIDLHSEIIECLGKQIAEKIDEEIIEEIEKVNLTFERKKLI